MRKTITLKEYAQKREKTKGSFKNLCSLLGFLGPYGVAFLMFFAFPLVFGIVISFCSFNGKSLFPNEFLGFDNYIKIFTARVMIKDFWSSMWVTFRFALIIVPLCILIPLGLALLINVKPPGYKFFRACIYLPGIFPLTATGLILLRMFATHNGFVNTFFDLSIDWFGEVSTGWFMVGLFCIWANIGGNFIIMCAGLENVDNSLIEASNIDGATRWQKLKYITLPSIKGQLVMCIFTTLIGYMNLYGQNYVLLSNTPDQDGIKTAVFRIQDMLLGSSKSYGLVSAMAICLGIIIAVITAIQMNVTKERKAGKAHATAFLKWKNEN